jgi:hypothetical protein
VIIERPRKYDDAPRPSWVDWRVKLDPTVDLSMFDDGDLN